MPENAVGVGDGALEGPLRTEMDIVVQEEIDLCKTCMHWAVAVQDTIELTTVFMDC